MNTNQFQCFCGQYVDTQDKSRECGWQTINGIDVPKIWICHKCEKKSEQAYQNSCIDVDFHQGQLAETEY